MGYNEEQLGAIADAIRAVTGQTDKIKATEFANIIKTFNGPTFEVKYNLQNLTSDGKSFGVMNKDYVATFTPAQYHEVPETLEISIGGVIAVQGTDYTYVNGVITIFGNKITGNIEITASGRRTGFYNVTLLQYGGEGTCYYYLNGGASTKLTLNTPVVLNGVNTLIIGLSAPIGGSTCRYEILKSDGTSITKENISAGGVERDITQYLQDGCTIRLYAN